MQSHTCVYVDEKFNRNLLCFSDHLWIGCTLRWFASKLFEIAKDLLEGIALVSYFDQIYGDTRLRLLNIALPLSELRCPGVLVSWCPRRWIVVQHRLFCWFEKIGCHCRLRNSIKDTRMQLLNIALPLGELWCPGVPVFWCLWMVVWAWGRARRRRRRRRSMNVNSW